MVFSRYDFLMNLRSVISSTIWLHTSTIFFRTLLLIKVTRCLVHSRTTPVTEDQVSPEQEQWCFSSRDKRLSGVWTRPASHTDVTLSVCLLCTTRRSLQSTGQRIISSLLYVTDPRSFLDLVSPSWRDLLALLFCSQRRDLGSMTHMIQYQEQEETRP
ncbi:hypothetical protein [Salmon gill poxvirus]|nr:hypothetical protein [Salmon gill poxvirus]